MNFKWGIKRGFWILLTGLSSLIRDDDGKSKLFFGNCAVKANIIMTKAGAVM